MACKYCALVSFISAILLIASPSAAEKQYDPGASDTEIKIGNINPYSGPASAYSLIAKTQAAFFRKLNAEARQLLLVDQDVGIIHLDPHLVGVGDEVR
jgi:hypothetical protein